MQGGSDQPSDLHERIAALEAEVSRLKEQLEATSQAGPSALIPILPRGTAKWREGEEQLDFAQAWIQLAQETGRVAAYTFDLDKGELIWSASTYALYGWDGPERRPTLERWLGAIHPDDRASAQAVAQAAISLGQEVGHTFRIVQPDGGIRWIEDRGKVLPSPQGRPQRIVGLNIDVTELKITQIALAESEERYRFTFENAAVGVSCVDLNGCLLHVNPYLCEFLGRSREDLLTRSFQELTHADDLQRDREERERLLRGETDRYSMEKRYIRPSGETVWADLNMTLQRGRDGTPSNYIAVVTNIQPRKRAEEQLNFVLKELGHRSKNLLMVLQSIIRQTARRVTTVEEFQDVLDDRLAGLAASQSLLLEHGDAGIPVRRLVEAQLAAFLPTGDDRVLIAGPDLRLTQEATQTLGLALHELATNACKYGSLSVPDGTVAIRWDAQYAARAPASFEMEWVEAGGPRVNRPTRSGFGRRVVETMVRASLEAAVSLDFSPEGVSWRMTAPRGCVVL